MRRLIDIFFNAKGTRPWLVILALLLASVVEGAGFATMLPLISVAAEGPGAGAGSPLNLLVRDFIQSVGLPIDLPTLLVIFVTILVIRSMVRLAALRHVGNAMAEVAASIRYRLIASLLQVRWPYFVQQPLGRIANVASAEAMRAGRAYTLVAELVSHSIQSIVMAVISFFVSWKIAVGAIVLGGGIALAMTAFVRGSRRAGRKQTMRTKDFLVYLSDTMGNLKPVRAMGREAAFSRLFEKRIAVLRKTVRRQVFNREALNNFQDLIMGITLGFCFWIAFTRWQVPIAELVVAGLLLYRSAGSIGKLQKAYQTAVELEASWYHAEDMIADATANPEIDKGTKIARFERAIELQDVRFAHGTTEVLRGVDLVIPAGSLTVLTGPSGGGKTTILDMILGLHRPSAGRVLIDGVDLQEISLASWRTKVGYVPQELVLFHDTIRANLAMGDAAIDDAMLLQALETAGAGDFVRELPQGLETVVGEKGAKLSGGQRQRIALARALIGSPRLLLLDEVTSALDPETAMEITLNIRSLADRVTILSITHRPEFLDVADLVYKIEGGVALPQPGVDSAHGTALAAG